MEQVAQTAVNFINTIRPYAWVIIGVALLTNGILVSVGGEEGRAKAKKALPFVAIGAVLIVGALELGRTIMGQIAF